MLLRLSQGDEHAFRQVFNSYRPKLYTYVVKLTESPAMSEDIVHDVFLKLWINRATLPTINNFNAWLYRIAHNQTYNGMKRVAKETLLLAELNREPDLDETNPGSRLQNKEVREFIQEAINKLSPQQKKVWVMSREEGLRQDEIARQLGISVSTVKGHMAEALRFLRHEVANNYAGYAVAIYVLLGLTLT